MSDPDLPPITALDQLLACRAQLTAANREIAEQSSRETAWARRFDEQVEHFAIRVYNERRRLLLKWRSDRRQLRCWIAKLDGLADAQDRVLASTAQRAERAEAEARRLRSALERVEKYLDDSECSSMCLPTLGSECNCGRMDAAMAAEAALTATPPSAPAEKPCHICHKPKG